PAALARGPSGARRCEAAEILAGARVDLYDVSFVEEERHLDRRARLEPRGLRAPLRRVAAHPGIGLSDRELDEVRQLDRHRAVADVEHVHLGVLPEIIAGVSDLLGLVGG